MILGFVNDPSFVDQTIEVVDIDNIPGHHGRLTDEQNSYFVDPQLIKDKRSTRLAIFGQPLISRMNIQVDDTFATDDIDTWIAASSTLQEHVFNIIERVLYRNVIQTPSELEDAFALEPGKYSGYVEGTLQISTDAEDVYIYDVLDSTHNILDWVRFTMDLGGTQVEFKIWINNLSFVSQYTNSTISEVVSPLALATLVDPSGIEDIYDAISESSINSATILASKISADNHTGIINYPTKYIDPINSVVETISFNVLYKGAQPGVLEIRLYIKNYLLNSGVSDEETWKAIMPDLFVVGQFFLIPLWDNFTERPTRTVYPSIAGYDMIEAVTSTVLYDLPEETIKKFEILGTAYREFMVIAIADDTNEVPTTILEEHPTYQRYSSQDVQYQYQDEITREFTTMLNRALAVAGGDTTYSSILVNTIGNREFASFVVNSLEYHIILKTSYLELMTA